MKLRPCELCGGGAAAVFCASDSAFLCWSCDADVHSANFLVARHVRSPLCANCKNFTGDGISGMGFRPFAPTCLSCPPDDPLDSLSSSDSSACISTTKECPAGRAVANYSSAPLDCLKAEDIFVNWCGQLGVGADTAVRTACRVLRACMEGWRILPFRVCLAASIWLGLRRSRGNSVLTWRVLKRLEEVSGVPAKVIVAAESKLERGLKGGRRRRAELEEGWAEC